MTAYDEKRDFMRMPIDCSFSFTTVEDGKEFMGNVINLSNNGILFTSNRSFENGTPLKIALTPSHSETASINATVVVARVSNNEKLFEVACRFKSVDS